jgi:Ca2+-binding RTX toxin-like protein
MPQYRHLSFAVAITAVLLLVLASVATAHPFHGKWHRGFDNVWVDRMGDAGLNVFTAEPGDRDLIIGRDGDDVLDAGDRRDVVRGNTGNDTITGGSGSDKLRGGRGDDTINGGVHHDRIFGGPGNDTIDGGAGWDLIRAGYGDDTVNSVDRRRDWVRCGPGNDTVTADKRDKVAANCETVIIATP